LDTADSLGAEFTLLSNQNAQKLCNHRKIIKNLEKGKAYDIDSISMQFKMEINYEFLTWIQYFCSHNGENTKM
jgi:hypothetical protein